MDSIRYALWIINSDEFINSKYHNEDLELIAESSTEDKNIEFVLKDALAVVAGNRNSINSKYHREDMKLIATSDPNVLQTSHSYPEHSLNNLAINLNVSNICRGFPCCSAGKQSACNAGDLGLEDPLEKGKATHFSI